MGKNSDIVNLVLRGASSAFLLRVGGTALAFALHILLARMLGVEEYGDYVYVLTWLSLISLIALQGFDSASQRFISTFVANEEWPFLRGYVKYSLVRVGLLSSAIAITIACMAYMGPIQVSQSLLHLIWIACLTLPLLCIFQLLSAFHRGFKNIVTSLLPGEVLRPVLIGFSALVIVYIGGRRLDAISTMWVTLLIVAFILVLSLWLMFKVAPPVLFSGKRIEFSRKEWVSIALPMYLMSMFGVLLTQTDTLMIGLLLDTSMAGIYSVASRTAALVGFGLFAVSTIAAPMISELYASKKNQELEALFRYTAWILLLFSVTALTVILIAGEYLLALFGADYTVAYTVLLVLSVGHLVNALSGTVGLAMTMTGHQLNASYYFGASALLNIVLNTALIPTFGIDGAAIATAATTIVRNVAMLIYVTRNLHMNPSVLAIFSNKKLHG